MVSEEDVHRAEDHQEEGTEIQEKDRAEQSWESSNNAMPLLALNHVSRLCNSVEASIDFYTKVLGFVLVERPPAFESFSGAWLFNYGVGIHLVQKKEGREQTDARPGKLDPMDNHISFQCANMGAVEARLREMGVEYMKRTVDSGEDGGSAGTPIIDQLFFNDLDGFMIEICNCENVELVPARPLLGRITLPRGRHNPPLKLD